MTPDRPDPGGTWAPIIYGKTHRVDEWWRALPAGVTRDGSAAGVVKGAVADGRVPSPRFVLARLAAGTLVGVVSSAARFGTEMAADSIGRPLYCFVGWYSSDPRAAVPGFAELSSGWEGPVRAEYDRVLRPVWMAAADEARTPTVTEPGPAPWVAASRPWTGERADAAGFSGTVQVFPSSSAAAVWQAIAEHGVRAAMVTGWEAYRSAIHPNLTHVCADDVTRSTPPTVAVPEASDRPASRSSRGDHGSGRTGQGGAYPRPGSDPAATYRPGAHEESWSGDSRRGHRWDPRGAGGGLLSPLKSLGRGVSGMLSGGEDVLPEAPPDWDNAWTFYPPASFEAQAGHYLFWYDIGDPAIHCESPRTGRFVWAGDHWLPDKAAPAPPAPARDPGYGPPPVSPAGQRGADERDLLDRPPVSGLGMVAPKAPPPDMRNKLNSTFGGFGRPAPGREAPPGSGTGAGAEPQDNDDSGDSGHESVDPPENDQTTPS